MAGSVPGSCKVEPSSIDRAAEGAVAQRWLGRYQAPVPVRCRGSFHLYAAQHLASGEPRLVVLAAPHANAAAANACLQRFAAAHRRVAHPTFPRVAELGVSAGRTFASFAIAPACDGEHAIARLGEERRRVSYPQAIAVVERLGEALLHAHATRDERGRPLSLGGMGWANVVIARDGMPYLIGLGHNLIGRDEHGALAGVPSFFVPPELARGGAPTPSADAYAFVTLQRSVLSYCELPAALERVFAGALRPQDAPLAEIVRFSTERVLGAPPDRRAGLGELRERWRREWNLLSIKPDLEGLQVNLTGLLAPASSPGADVNAQAAALVLGPEACWFRTADGAIQRLDGRGPLKRLLLRLALEHLRGEGRPLAADELLAAGWPDQRVDRSSGLNRVYVALALLRKLGLRSALQRDDRGYRIDPALSVRFEGSAQLLVRSRGDLARRSTHHG